MSFKKKKGRGEKKTHESLINNLSTTLKLHKVFWVLTTALVPLGLAERPALAAETEGPGP